MKHGSIKNNFLYVSLLVCLFSVVFSGCGVTDTSDNATAVNPRQPTTQANANLSPYPTFTDAQATLQAVGREYDSLAKTQTAHPELTQLGPTMDALKQKFDALVYTLPSPTRTAQSNLIAGTAATASISIPTAEPYPTRPPVIGITKDCESAFSHTMDITNCWFGFIKDEYVSVFAGTFEGDIHQGILTVSRISRSRAETYKTATQHGTITITEATGTRLTLTAQDGTIFIFDATKQTWEVRDTK